MFIYITSDKSDDTIPYQSHKSLSISSYNMTVKLVGVKLINSFIIIEKLPVISVFTSDTIIGFYCTHIMVNIIFKIVIQTTVLIYINVIT